MDPSGSLHWGLIATAPCTFCGRPHAGGACVHERFARRPDALFARA